MNAILWIALGVAVTGAIFYLLVMRVLARESRETDKKIDYSKIREWKDEDD